MDTGPFPNSPHSFAGRTTCIPSPSPSPSNDSGSSTAYHIPTAFRLRGPLDPAALHRALLAIVERHESLRTCFVESNGTPGQIVRSSVILPLPVTDLSNLSGEAQTAAAVLGHNFPGSPWYRDSYVLLTGENLEPAEDKQSWISRVWKTVF